MNPDPSETAAEHCARRILETTPFTMRLIRQKMRGEAGESLSVPQFRVLAFLGHHSGISLSALAEHLGVADATASTMVERLVKRGLVSRDIHPDERRRVAIRLTEEGSALLERARAKARSFLAGSLEALDEGRIRKIQEGLELLMDALSRTGEARP
jgi:DNA-binding MarR family transcriptional regulator